MQTPVEIVGAIIKTVQFNTKHFHNKSLLSLLTYIIIGSYIILPKYIYQFTVCIGKQLIFLYIVCRFLKDLYKTTL